MVAGKVVLKATEELTSSVLVGDQTLDNEHWNQPPYKVDISYRSLRSIRDLFFR
jgi:hypothetical protein